jgi:hypothetical protein
MRERRDELAGEWDYHQQHAISHFDRAYETSNGMQNRMGLKVLCWNPAVDRFMSGRVGGDWVDVSQHYETIERSRILATFLRFRLPPMPFARTVLRNESYILIRVNCF